MRLLLFLLVSCSSPGFYYDRYGLGDGKLLHFDDPKKDRSVSECGPGYKCVVMFSNEFYKMKSDFERLIETCE